MKIFRKSMLCSVAVLLMYTPVYAENTLTEESIRAFYETMKEVQLSDVEAVVAFYDKHTHPDSHTTVHISKFVMGKTLDDEIVEMNKADMLDRTRKAHNKDELKKVDINILNIKIEPDGKKAKVKATAKGDFKIQVASSEGNKELDASQFMTCDDIIVLSSDNIIQTLESICDIDATIGPVKKLHPKPVP